MASKIGGPQSSTEPLITAEELAQEEHLLTFPHLNRSDVLELGKIAIRRNEKTDLSFACRIEYNNMVVFQYLPAGTNQFNVDWMEKKIEAVKTFRTTTMGLWVLYDAKGHKRVDTTPVPQSCLVKAGGGFPLMTEDGEVVAAFAVSGPGDQNDHYFGIECLEEFREMLKKQE